MMGEKKPSDIAFNSPLLKGRVNALDLSPEMDSPLRSPGHGASAFKKQSAVKDTIIKPMRCDSKKTSVNPDNYKFEEEKKTSK